MTEPEQPVVAVPLRAAAAKAALTLRATADGFARRDDAEHPLSQLLVDSLRKDANDIDAALAVEAVRPETDIDEERLRRAIYTVSVRHNWAETLDTEDRTAEIIAAYREPS